VNGGELRLAAAQEKTLPIGNGRSRFSRLVRARLSSPPGPATRTMNGASFRIHSFIES